MAPTTREPTSGQIQAKALDELSTTVAPHSRLITLDTDHPGYDPRDAIDSARISTELGWQPRHSFADAMAMGDTRFEVRLNQRLAHDFDQVAQFTGLNRAEVFRREIALYKTVKREEEQQGT